MRLSHLPRPFLVCVLTGRTIDQTIATMRLAAYDGADAYELNLPLLASAGTDALERVVGTVARPVYTSCRRAEFMTVYGIPKSELPAWTDTERMQRQLDLLPLGFVALDMEMDTFDPHPAPPLGTAAAQSFAQSSGAPAELTRDPGAIARQGEIIDAVHEAGAEVILSCHTGRPQSADGLVELVRMAGARGADMVKVVSPCPMLSDLLALFEATGRLNGDLAIPYILVGAGPNGTLSRKIGMTLGCGWALGQQRLVPGGFHDQPLIGHLRELRRLVP